MARCGERSAPHRPATPLTRSSGRGAEERERRGWLTTRARRRRRTWDFDIPRCQLALDSHMRSLSGGTGRSVTFVASLQSETHPLTQQIACCARDSRVSLLLPRNEADRCKTYSSPSSFNPSTSRAPTLVVPSGLSTLPRCERVRTAQSGASRAETSAGGSTFSPSISHRTWSAFHCHDLTIWTKASTLWASPSATITPG